MAQTIQTWDWRFGLAIAVLEHVFVWTLSCEDSKVKLKFSKRQRFKKEMVLIPSWSFPSNNFWDKLGWFGLNLPGFSRGCRRTFTGPSGAESPQKFGPFWGWTLKFSAGKWQERHVIFQRSPSQRFTVNECKWSTKVQALGYFSREKRPVFLCFSCCIQFLEVCFAMLCPSCINLLVKPYVSQNSRAVTGWLPQ